ncbi:cyanophycin synthetase [Pleurocapsales cyanobacterium LEGE 10410]|nr:cyanophycin synthetase [Pleurocapsales cyanobacterium LEGE 10410]
MKILKVKTLRGPNYWSIQHQKLIVLQLDLKELAEKRSDEIPDFYQGLTEVFSGSTSPRWNGLLKQLEEGAFLEKIVPQVALELQSLAGMPVKFSCTRSTSYSGVYQVIFEYREEKAGRYAARAAVRLCQNLADRGYYPSSELEQDLRDLRELRAEGALGPSTEAIIQEAEARGIPWMQLNTRAMTQLGYGANQKRIQATQSDRTSILGIELAGDKEATKEILQKLGIPVPQGINIRYLDELKGAIERVGDFPVVIKPSDCNHGRGVTTDINSWREAELAFDTAIGVSKIKEVIVERYHRGRDHRVLVVGGKMVAVAERVPAHVVGDDRSTIEELIESANRDPRRGEGHNNVMTRIELDRSSFELLRQQRATLDTILPAGEICYLKATANLSTGGMAIDRTDEIHPDNIWLAERAARIVGLDIAGIDIVTPDISRSLSEVNGVAIEVNAAPGFRMHVCPSQGKSRNVAAPVIDLLFPPRSNPRIPILAVTGTNGKTTTTRLLAHILRQTRRTVGYTTTDGIYVDDYLVEAGDNTGPQSARLILQDPTVEVAVLETARGGILRSGLGFDACDVGIVLNVTGDHLGIDGIDTIEDMAALKSVVAKSVFPHGYAVLNADDPLVAEMSQRTKAQVAYFSMDPQNELVQSQIRQGGLAAVYEHGYLSILQGDQTLRIQQAIDVPLTLGGLAPFMIANALAASLAAFTQGVALEDIRQALTTFRASVSQTPGRMNLFNLGSYHALVDYAHNLASYQALGSFVCNWSGERIGVVGAPGDRRDEDFIALGKLSARIFDRIVVKEDDDTRGRRRGEVANLICEGIDREKPDCRYESILTETTAIDIALDEAPQGSLVVILPEKVGRTLDLIEARHPQSESC